MDQSANNNCENDSCVKIMIVSEEDLPSETSSPSSASSCSSLSRGIESQEEGSCARSEKELQMDEKAIVLKRKHESDNNTNEVERLHDEEAEREEADDIVKHRKCHNRPELDDTDRDDEFEQLVQNVLRLCARIDSLPHTVNDCLQLVQLAANMIVNKATAFVECWRHEVLEKATTFLTNVKGAYREWSTMVESLENHLMNMHAKCTCGELYKCLHFNRVQYCFLALRAMHGVLTQAQRIVAFLRNLCMMEQHSLKPELSLSWRNVRLTAKPNTATLDMFNSFLQRLKREFSKNVRLFKDARTAMQSKEGCAEESFASNNEKELYSCMGKTEDAIKHCWAKFGEMIM